MFSRVVQFLVMYCFFFLHCSFLHIVLLLFTASCDVLIAAQEAKITVPPQPINTSVNGGVEFNCTAVANGFVWRANEVQLDNREGVAIFTEAVNKAMNIRTSTLRMTVSSTENATNITCIAISQFPPSSDISDSALLLVQGLLEPASNLTMATFNSSTVLISWSAPFTLQGVPILEYSVTIINSACSDRNNTILAAGNTTMVYYAIDPYVNNNITVTVFPINMAGKGESVFTTTNILSQPLSPTSTTVVVVVPSISQHTKASLTITMTTTNLISASTTTTDFDNNATALLSTIELITILSVSSVIALILLLTTALLLFLCCLRRGHIKRKEAQKVLKDVIMMNDSEAYAVVRRHAQLQQIDTNDNSAYGVLR